MIRSIVSKSFNTNDPTIINVVVETYESGAVVEYPKPAPRLVLTVDKPQIIANGTDAATITATFESCSLVSGEIVWAKMKPVGNVTFNVNLRPTVVAIDAAGNAVLSVSTTIAGLYRVVASCPNYPDVSTVVEAIA